MSPTRTTFGFTFLKGLAKTKLSRSEPPFPLMSARDTKHSPSSSSMEDKEEPQEEEPVQDEPNRDGADDTKNELKKITLIVRPTRETMNQHKLQQMDLDSGAASRIRRWIDSCDEKPPKRMKAT